ncbi:hypothetical protein EPO34_00785 [Patescibacteria group bacterium]|nr:MAG: hypothetical protein EPO34_00785 [Patescibacteria group bacterium]
MKRLVATLPLAALILVGAGCGASTATNPLTGTTTYDDGAGTRVQVGNGVSIPADFPADIPMYPGATVVTAMTSAQEGRQGASLMLTTPDAVAAASGWYEQELVGDGWEKSGNFAVNGSDMRAYEKGDAALSVTASPGDEGLTSILVIWAPQD